MSNITDLCLADSLECSYNEERDMYDVQTDVLLNMEDEDVARAVRPLSEFDETDHVLGLSLSERWDHEQERPALMGHDQFGPIYEDDDGLDISQAGSRYCWTAENPVLAPEAVLIDQKSRLMAEKAPEKSFYSAARPHKASHRNYLAIMVFLNAHKGNQALLKKAWKRLWQRHFAAKKTGEFLSSKELSKVCKAFESLGIMSKKRAVQKAEEEKQQVQQKRVELVSQYKELRF